MNTYTRIDFFNSCDAFNLIFQFGFVQHIFLDADVMLPEYLITKEGKNDNEGLFVADLTRWEKRMSLECVLPEYAVDAMHLLKLHDQVYITLKDGRSAQMRNIEVKDNWEGSGCYAKVTISWMNEVISQSAGCDNMAGLAV